MNIRITNNKVEIDGYVNAVERLSRPMNDRLGKFVERVKCGAFKKALDRNDNIRILLNHRWDKDLGGTKEGSLDLNEDTIGLHARATITDSDVVEMAKRGDLVGWSFGFTDRADGVEVGTENGMTVRNLTDMNLYEVSLVSRERVPAYAGTSIIVRTADDNENMNVSDVTECEINTETIETREKEEVEPEKEIDYSEYHKMIDEMKGE